MGGGGNMNRCQSAIHLTPTRTVDDAKEYGELEESSLFLSTSPTGVAERLPLPRRDTAPCSLDLYLKSIPSVADRSEQWLNASSSDHASQKCLTVLQGEVAHASPTQADVLVSAEATTCHVVALRSTHATAGQPALASMAHIDQPDVYEACLEKMVQEHLQHHLEQTTDEYGFYIDSEDEEDDECFHEDCVDSNCQGSFLPQPDFGTNSTGKLRRSQSMPTLPVEVELHIAGGYLDTDGTSQSLSTSIVHSFSKLADKYQGQLKISLSTAAISSMNTTTDGSTKPRSRGLALNTHTGQVTPITSALPVELEGPALELRHARLFSSPQDEPKSLAVIHSSQTDGITIDPFLYQAQPQLNALLQVPDPILLQVTSTSPDCESERFCSDLKRTISFVNTVPSELVFSQQRPLVYSRSATALNEWEPVV